jgi:hypothetical protein
MFEKLEVQYCFVVGYPPLPKRMVRKRVGAPISGTIKCNTLQTFLVSIGCR